MVAFPAMNVTLLEYEPMSMGVRSVSAAMIFIRPSEQPSVSAATWAVIVSEPCPISDAPVYTTTPPSRSILIFTVECGMSERMIELAAPLT